jgi:cell division septal protein FtsQ
MASPFVADLGRAARGAPRAAIALPLSVISRRGVIVAALLALTLSATYMLWFRHSSFVAVEEVEVSGLTFAEGEIASALTDAGQRMSTLDTDVAALERAVRRYPTVASISVETDFPDRLAIEVHERAPVATVGAGEGVPVAGDGTVLSGVETGKLKLPAIEAGSVPASGRVRGTALAQAEILAAAPDPLRPAIEGIGVDREHGVEVALAGEVELRFGDSRDAGAKWAAAAAILADPKLDQISYIDLRLPGRPAVGGAPAPVSETEAPEESIAPAPEPIAPVPSEPAPTATETPVPAPTDPAAAVPPESTAPPATPAPATGVAGSTAAP